MFGGPGCPRRERHAVGERNQGGGKQTGAGASGQALKHFMISSMKRP